MLLCSVIFSQYLYIIMEQWCGKNVFKVKGIKLFHQGGNREEEISELEANLERLRSERMRRSAEKHSGPSGVGGQDHVVVILVISTKMFSVFGGNP